MNPDSFQWSTKKYLSRGRTTGQGLFSHSLLSEPPRPMNSKRIEGLCRKARHAMDSGREYKCQLISIQRPWTKWFLITRTNGTTQWKIRISRVTPRIFSPISSKNSLIINKIWAHQDLVVAMKLVKNLPSRGARSYRHYSILIRVNSPSKRRCSFSLSRRNLISRRVQISITAATLLPQNKCKTVLRLV